jgi:hypothetical protein
MLFFDQSIQLVAKGRDMDKTFHHQFGKLDEKAERSNTGDVCIKNFPKVFLHILEPFQVDDLALRFHCLPLTQGGLFGNLRQCSGQLPPLTLQ